MDTHGHEEVAEAAGLPLLKKGFKVRMGEPRLQAFYLGNWLTDVSQVIDPKVGPKVKLKAHTFVDDAMRWLLNTRWLRDDSGFRPVADWLQVVPVLEEISNETHETIEALIDWVLKPPPTTPPALPEPSRLFKVAQAALLLKGFFKFVHPEETGKPPKMDLSAYIAVSEKHFTQYYPHEHLDRPEIDQPVPPPPGADTRYADVVATGPSTAIALQDPDLYRYLRDDIKYLAGILTQLDLTWARKYLSQPSAMPLMDDNLDWNLGLARLGHTVHGVEDFFAHSNFIEHAAVVMGDPFLPKSNQVYASRFLKRLKRYNYLENPSDWRLADPEPHIVTGYFDFIDTLNSLAHMLVDNVLGVFDLESQDASEDLHWVKSATTLSPEALKLAEYKASIYYHDLMELFEDPEKLVDEAADNAVADAVRAFLEEIDKTLGESVVQKMIKFAEACERGSVDQATMTKLVRHMPLFKALVDQQKPAGPWNEADVAKLLKAFYDVTLLLRQTVSGISLEISYYKFLVNLTELMATPSLWLRKKLAEKMKEFPVDYATKVGVWVGKEVFLYSWGSMRLGCHSLLSKDHDVHEEHRYKNMSDCAKLVHHAVVKTLMRWAEPNYDSQPENQKFVNWLVLLEHYLCHPRYGVACNTEQEVLIEVLHVPTVYELRLGFDNLVKQLVLQYRPTELPSDDDAVRQRILEANITSVKKPGRTEESALQRFAHGFKLHIHPLLPLAGILVPNLPVKVPTCNPQSSPNWYMPVMTGGWKQQSANHPANVVYHASEVAAEQALALLDAKRIELENSYR